MEELAASSLIWVGSMSSCPLPINPHHSFATTCHLSKKSQAIKLRSLSIPTVLHFGQFKINGYIPDYPVHDNASCLPPQDTGGHAPMAK